MLIIYFYNNLAASNSTVQADTWFKQWVMPVSYWNSIMGPTWTLDYFAYLWTLNSTFSDTTLQGAFTLYVHADPSATATAGRNTAYELVLQYLNALNTNAGTFTYYTGVGKGVSTAVKYLAYLDVVKTYVATPAKSIANYVTDFHAAQLLSDSGTTYDTIVSALNTASYVKLINGFASA